MEQQRISRTPAYRLALVIVSLVILAWLAILALAPGGTAHSAHTSGADMPAMAEHQHAAPTGAVAEHIRAETEPVRFCVSATLEPFDGSLDQIRSIGGAEAGERLHRCLADTLFDHQGQATLDELAVQTEHFSACFAALATEAPADKPAAVDDTLACVQESV